MKHFTDFFSQLFLWFRLWTKRLFLHPFFLFTLILLPAATLFISRSDFSGDAILRIALCTEPETAASTKNLNNRPDDNNAAHKNNMSAHTDSISAENLKNELIALSNNTVEFYSVSSKEEVYADISDKKAVSGYIFPADLEQRLKTYAAEKKPFITVIQHDEEMSNKLVNEIILSRLYKTHAWQILLDFISEKISKKKNFTLDVPFLQERVKAYDRHELLFHFEYADGSENTLLNEPASLLLMPLRGVIAVLTFLSCMAGALTWYEDKLNGVSRNLSGKKQKLCMFFSLFVPALFAGGLGLFSLGMTELSEGFQKETSSMLAFLFACISLNFFLLSIFRQKEVFLSLLPGITVGSLLLCPVFFDLSIYSPVIKLLRSLFPAHYYLRSLHSTSDLWYMFVYGIFFLLCGWLFRKMLHRRYCSGC